MKYLINGSLNIKTIITALISSFLTFSSVSALAKGTYTLFEGKKAQERLDIQNEFNRGILIKAFNEVSSLKNIEGMSVVDFGCGTSSAYPDIRSLIGPSGKYIGIDNSEKQIEFNKARFKDVNYIIGDEKEKTVQEVLASADIIYIRFVVMHQKNPKDFLQMIYSIAKPGAFIIIQEPESDEEKKKFTAAKYPFAIELCDFKTLIGKKRGLDYNFAPKIEKYLQILTSNKLIHKTECVEIPMTQAKLFLRKTFNEIHAKDPAVLNEELLARYMNILSKLPEGENDKWRLDLMHTIIVQK